MSLQWEQGRRTARTLSRHDGAPYVVFELLDGNTLRDALAAAALPLSKAIECARQVALGLAAAHAKGITHRDIKPENLVVTSDGRLKALDFGLAKLCEETGASGATRLHQSTEAGVVLGTVGYMSPEHVRGQGGPTSSASASCCSRCWRGRGRLPATRRPTR